MTFQASFDPPALPEQQYASKKDFSIPNEEEITKHEVDAAEVENTSKLMVDESPKKFTSQALETVPEMPVTSSNGSDVVGTTDGLNFTGFVNRNLKKVKTVKVSILVMKYSHASSVAASQILNWQGHLALMSDTQTVDFLLPLLSIFIFLSVCSQCEWE